MISGQSFSPPLTLGAVLQLQGYKAAERIIKAPEWNALEGDPLLAVIQNKIQGSVLHKDVNFIRLLLRKGVIATDRHIKAINKRQISNNAFLGGVKKLLHIYADKITGLFQENNPKLYASLICTALNEYIAIHGTNEKVNDFINRLFNYLKINQVKINLLYRYNGRPLIELSVLSNNNTFFESLLELDNLELGNTESTPDPHESPSTVPKNARRLPSEKKLRISKSGLKESKSQEINIELWAALLAACKNGNRNIVRRLYEKFPQKLQQQIQRTVETTPLRIAIETGQPDLVRDLLTEQKMNADETYKDGLSPLKCALKGTSEKILALILSVTDKSNVAAIYRFAKTYGVSDAFWALLNEHFGREKPQLSENLDWDSNEFRSDSPKCEMDDTDVRMKDVNSDENQADLSDDRQQNTPSSSHGGHSAIQSHTPTQRNKQPRKKSSQKKEEVKFVRRGMVRDVVPSDSKSGAFRTLRFDKTMSSSSSSSSIAAAASYSDQEMKTNPRSNTSSPTVAMHDSPDDKMSSSSSSSSIAAAAYSDQEMEAIPQLNTSSRTVAMHDVHDSPDDEKMNESQSELVPMMVEESASSNNPNSRVNIEYGYESDVNTPDTDSDEDDQESHEMQIPSALGELAKKFQSSGSAWVPFYRAIHFFRKPNNEDELNGYYFVREQRRELSHIVKQGQLVGNVLDPLLESLAVKELREQGDMNAREKVRASVLHLQQSGAGYVGDQKFRSKYDYHQQVYSNTYGTYHNTLGNESKVFDFPFTQNPNVSMGSLFDALRYGLVKKHQAFVNSIAYAHDLAVRAVRNILSPA